MIPILYDTNETAFATNGLGRLRDCISCVVTEERNGVYECDFEYPMDGANFDLIQIGRTIGITHDESGDIEPFDIVSYSRPIEGVVTFHCVHISYRLSYMTVTASGINSLADAFTAFASAEPSMPFSFDTDKTSTGYVAAFNGVPKTVRSILGGTEGSILDAYGGEYSFNNWSVYLHTARGQMRNFAIRYGVNMLDYNEDYDSQGTYSSCMPYWTDGTDTVLGDRVDSTGMTVTGRDECVPLDLSDKFETKPTKAQVEAEAMAYLNEHNTYIPSQNIKVDFVRLQDMGYEDLGVLMQCNLCDTIKVIFPDYNSSGTYKIVKTVWNVLENRYDEMELGELSTTLAEALGITNGLGGGGGSGVMRALFDFVYPVGSYYETSDTSFDPNQSWGGTWVLETEGQVHISGSINGTYQVDGAPTDTTDGGEATHTLLTSEMPSHAHNPSVAGSGYMSYKLNAGVGRNRHATSSSGTLKYVFGSSTQDDLVYSSTSANTGGGDAHNNMQPYIIVHRWHRTA